MVLICDKPYQNNDFQPHFDLYPSHSAIFKNTLYKPSLKEIILSSLHTPDPVKHYLPNSLFIISIKNKKKSFIQVLSKHSPTKNFTTFH